MVTQSCTDDGEFVRSCDCVPMAFTAESPPVHRASSPHGASSNSGCCPFKYCHRGPFFLCFSFFTPPIIGTTVDMCDPASIRGSEVFVVR